jgi:hypothetical protein
MYPRLVIFRAGQGEGPRSGRSPRNSILSTEPARLQELHFLAEELSGEYGSFSVWNSKDEAEAANAVIAPQLQQRLAGRLQGAPNRWFFEVVEPTPGA